MKKLFLFVVMLFPLFLTGCNDDDHENDGIRTAAWNALGEESKDSVISDWKIAPVREDTFEGKKVYVVILNTEYDALLGPIAVCLDRKTLKLVGFYARY